MNVEVHVLGSAVLNKPRLTVIGLAVTIFAFVSPSISGANGELKPSPKCDSILAQTSLDKRQLELLLNSMKNSKELTYRILTIEVQGEKRTVVIVGEPHFAKQNDIDVSRPLINQFRHIGTENGDTNSDKQFTYHLLPVGILALPSLFINKLIRGATTGSPMNSAFGARSARIVDNVERGHEPLWTEEVNLALFSLAHLAETFCMGVCVVSTFRAIASGNPFPELLQFSLAGGYTLLFNLAVNYIGKYGSSMPLVANRDKTIAKNIDSTLRGETEFPSYLVLVGSGHVPGVTKLLISEYGFTNIQLDEIQP